jgi:hypothetical protein
VFLRPLQEENDWSNGVVSGATGLYFTVSGLTGALIVATRLAGALGPSPKTGGPQSVGVAAYPSPSVADSEALMRFAEKALESARSRGGGILTPVSR